MMRELIRQKPFEPSEELRSRCGITSQRLYQQHCSKRRGESQRAGSLLASGVEESLDAVSIQSHYSDVDGKVREYVELERLHIETKAAENLSKEKKKEAWPTTESAASVGSTKSTTQRTPKRSNAFLTEVKRQEKRYKEKMGLKVRELEQDQKQFEERLSFEKKTSETQFEDRVQASNREMILECAKILALTTV
ncbi:hypothetical protein GQ600_8268 [Phytophthora cactorum]|nr:hypothetical protein GQ600_8268 [Phytophthora cactorum]